MIIHKVVKKPYTLIYKSSWPLMIQNDDLYVYFYSKKEGKRNKDSDGTMTETLSKLTDYVIMIVYYFHFQSLIFSLTKDCNKSKLSIQQIHVSTLSPRLVYFRCLYSLPGPHPALWY